MKSMMMMIQGDPRLQMQVPEKQLDGKRRFYQFSQVWVGYLCEQGEPGPQALLLCYVGAIASLVLYAFIIAKSNINLA